MRDWQNLTLGDMAKAFTRYRPFIALVAAVFLIVTVGGGSGDDGDTDLATAGPTATTAPTGAAGEGLTATDPGATTSDPAATGTDATGGATAGVTTGGAGAGGGARPTSGGGAVQTPSSGPIEVSGEPGPDCDRGTGRLAMPTRYAPPCKPKWTGGTNNGGATSPQGVSANEIHVVWYRVKPDPGTQAALEQAGAADPPENAKATAQAYLDMYSKHYETYGRKLKVTLFDGSGESDDDAAAKADAIKIATQLKAFAVINDANNAFVDELVARKVLCICTTSQPQEFYQARSPYAGYTGLMSSTQGYVQRAEYIGKRLAGRPPKYLGEPTKSDPTYPKEARTFGLLYFETPDRAYEQGVKFFDQELRTKYGVTLKVMSPFTGAIGPGADPAQTQRQAGPLIQKMKDAKVTSLIYSGDPLSPAIFTKEATNQQYFPEWILTGSALTDTSIFARTYDKLQWNRAFGVSFLTARVPQEEGDAYRLHVWHFGKPPTAENGYGVIHAPIFYFMLGVHLAGPNLNPVTWQQGLFSYPVTGAGSVTSAALSFGNHGLWPFTDFTGFDDVTEIWWDDQARGEDETGAYGAGLYQYVDGGKRYLPGQHPTAEPKAFVREGAVTIYPTTPDAEKPPNHKHDPAHHRNY